MNSEIIDIESIVNQMTEASKKFYQDPKGEKNIQKCIQHRDFLQKLYCEAVQIPDKTGSARVLEVMKILKDGVDYFNKKITQLARYH